MNFCFVAHLDTSLVMERLSKLDPQAWKGSRQRSGAGNFLVGLGASVPLQGREISSADFPVKDCGELEHWATMKRLLSQAATAIMATDFGPHLSGRFGRAMLSVLRAGATIPWHVDDGAYYERHVRFHIPLVTSPGAMHYIGPETLHMDVGALWYFNNRTRHSAANWGGLDRVHVAFDMLKAGAGHA